MPAKKQLNASLKVFQKRRLANNPREIREKFPREIWKIEAQSMRNKPDRCGNAGSTQSNMASV